MPKTLQPSIDPLLRLLEKRAPRPLTLTQLARELEWDSFSPKQLRALLEEQVAQRKLRRIGKTRYQWVRDVDRAPATRGPGARRKKGAESIEGLYSRIRAGYGFVEVLGSKAKQFARDILIPRDMESEALHGDRVEVEIIRRDFRTRRFTGRIVRVVSRAHERIIGTLERERGGWWLIPEDELLPPVQLIGETMPERDDAGLVAVVHITRQPTTTRNPAGELEEIIGEGDDPRVQFLVIVYEHGLRTEFSPEVIAEAERLPADPSEAEVTTDREDLRALPFVTIDGESARDFDDAVCLESLPGGRCR